MNRQAFLVGLPVVSLIVTSALPSLVWAKEGSEFHSGSDSGELTEHHTPSPSPLATIKQHLEDIQEHQQEIKSTLASKSAELKQRLDDTKVKVCQNRQTGIQARLNSLNKRAGKDLALFAAVTDKAEAFATNHHLTVADYGSLQNNVAATKAQAAADLLAMQQVAGSFSCTSDGPKQQLQTFKTEAEHLRLSIKAYRSAVHDLLVAIKTAAKTVKASPTPTEVQS